MKISVNRDVKLLSLGFFLIFFSYTGVQQYVTTFFTKQNLPHVGFWSLILIYLMLTLTSPLAGIVVSKFGSKRVMIVTAPFYALVNVALVSGSRVFVYLASALLGVAAAHLWVGQNVHLLKASSKVNYGENAGFFNTLFALGSTLGAILLGALVNTFSFTIPILVYAILPLTAIIPFLTLTEYGSSPIHRQWELLVHTAKSPTTLRLSTIFFSYMFVLGLAVSVIPLDVSKTLGVVYVGASAALFFGIPVLLSYAVGRLSDTIGRTKTIVIAYGLALLGLLFVYASESTIPFVLGIVILAINFAMMNPLSIALVGDVTMESNRNVLTSWWWMVRQLGTLVALTSATKIQGRGIYLVALGTLFITLLLVLPMLAEPLKSVKIKLRAEVG